MKRKLVETISIDPLDSSYLEYYFFQWESYKELLSYILLKRDEFSLEYNIDNYTHFMNEYKEARFKYHLKLNDTLETACSQYKNDSAYDFEVNFENATIAIYKKGE